VRVPLLVVVVVGLSAFSFLLVLPDGLAIGRSLTPEFSMASTGEMPRSSLSWLAKKALSGLVSEQFSQALSMVTLAIAAVAMIEPSSDPSYTCKEPHHSDDGISSPSLCK
jgi:hypothetical protein